MEHGRDAGRAGIVSAFTAGQIVFTIDGRESEYVAAAGDRHAVLFVFEDENGEPVRDEARIVDRVFPEPPVARYAESVTKARAELDEARTETAALRSEQRDLRAQEQKLRASIKAAESEAPPHWADLLAGRVTHFVDLQGRIHASKCPGRRPEAFTARWESDCRRSDHWVLECRAGDGYERIPVTPCVSLDEAREVAARTIAASVKNSLAATYASGIETDLARAKAGGVVLAPDVLAAAKARLCELATAGVKAAEQALAKAKAALVKAETTAATPEGRA